jgi:bla regulator protein blaR1
MIPAGFHVGSKFLALILDAASRSLLLGCFLAAVLAAFRLRGVRAKLLAWRGLLLVAIAMPLLTWIIPSVPLPIPVPSFSRNTASAAVEAAPPDLAPAPEATVPLDDVRAVPHRDSISVETSPELPVAPLPGFALPAAPTSFSWSLLATALYLAVAFVFFARMLIGMYFGARLRRGSHAVPDAEALILLATASRASGLGTLPRLAESDAVAVPVTLGILRPAILLPASWRDWERDELAAVLAHEASHVGRRDSLIQLLALLHRAVFWFSPLSWWLNGHLADLAEQASDEAALAGGADRTRYADALAGFLADLQTAPSRVWWHGVAMAKSGDGEKRVNRILAWGQSAPSRANRWLIAAAVVICLPAIALSVAAHPSAYDPQNIAAPPSPAPPQPPEQLAPPVEIPVPPPGQVAAPDAPPLAVPLPPVAPLTPMAIPAPPALPQGTSPVPMAAPASPAVAIPDPPQPSQAQTPAPPTFAPPPPPAPVNPASKDWGDFGMYGPYFPWGPQFMIVTRGANKLLMIGTLWGPDAEHVGELRSKIPGDFIWFEHDGKSYIIRDQAIINRAKQIWDQRADSAKRQQELQAKEQELSREMREQVQAKMEEIRVKVPDMSADLQKLQSEVKDLNAKGATIQQLGDLQQQVGELQQALGEARWNSNLAEINRRAGELGSRMGDIGRQIGELARQSVEQARQTSEQMRQLFDSAIANGKAKPE